VSKRHKDEAPTSPPKPPLEVKRATSVPAAPQKEVSQRASLQMGTVHMKMPPIDLTATTPKKPGTTPKRESHFKPLPAAAQAGPTLTQKAPLAVLIATLPVRRDEQGGEGPTDSTSSTDSSADWSTFDPRPESEDDSSSSSPSSDSEHDARERQEVKDEQGSNRAQDQKKGIAC
jgi:hypothetical protein